MNKFLYKAQNLFLLFFLSLLISGCGGAKGNIHKAAVKADLAKVKRIVANGGDINQRDEKKVTALHIAAYYGQRDHILLAKWLLANGADASLKDYKGNTPQAVAEDRGNDDIAKILAGAASSGGGKGKSGGGRQLMDGGTGVSEVINF